MKIKLLSFHVKAFTLLVCIFLFGLNTASANYFYGEEVDTFCAGKPGFENPPVFGGVGSPFDQTNCSKCHNPSGPGNGQTPAFNIYKNNGRNPNQALCDLVAPPPAPTCTDADKDGYYLEADCPMGAGKPIDCNDNNAAINPGAIEICTDGVDNNCDRLTDTQDTATCPIVGGVCTDKDGDTFSIEGGECGLVDCDDNNALVNPMATEICGDNIDNNCSGKIDLADPAVDKNTCPVVCIDEDMDGYSVTGGSCGPIDCNDADATINPGAQEMCTDNVDNNCNMLVDMDDASCQVMGDQAKLKELKAQLRAHNQECKKVKKQLKQEIKVLKKKIESANNVYEDDEDEDEYEDEDEDKKKVRKNKKDEDDEDEEEDDD